jgi:Succinate dehydrogenase/fumarate reductase, flavoprotein subunit
VFDMYQNITGENPCQTPSCIFAVIRITMGGVWVVYNLMTTIPCDYSIGEASFSDRGAIRLGASAVMQALADGFFVLPYTIGDDLAGRLGEATVPDNDPVFAEAEAGAHAQINRFMSIGGTLSVDWFHGEVGKIVRDYIGMERTREGLEKALSEILALEEEFWKDLRLPG